MINYAYFQDVKESSMFFVFFYCFRLFQDKSRPVLEQFLFFDTFKRYFFRYRSFLYKPLVIFRPANTFELVYLFPFIFTKINL